MDAPKKRPSIKGKKKVGSSDFVQPDQLLDSEEGSVRISPDGMGAKGSEENFSQGESNVEDAPRPSAKKRGRIRRAESAGKDASGTAGEKRRRLIAIAAAAAAAVLLAASLFVWNTYFRYDDSADIKGEWLVSDGSMVVVIDAQSIKMPDAAYDYVLDDKKKTIAFTFAELSGGGSYDFSNGRKTFAVSEGQGQNNVVVTTFYKMSDKADAKPRRLSDEKAEQALSKYGPQEQVTAVSEEPQTDSEDAGKGKKNVQDA